MDTVGDQEGEDLPECSAPTSFPVTIRGMESEEAACELGALVGEWVREFSRYIDLADLDGITIAFDYRQALLDLDRGYKANIELTPSDGATIGIAMTPKVLRDGYLKSHIVIDAHLGIHLGNPSNGLFRLALHTLAHECAHVEISSRFNSRFPGILLQRRFANDQEAYRWDIILACWEEYAATWLSAPIGEDPTEGYEDNFLLLLSETRPKANECIKAYRTHANVSQVLNEVVHGYGRLMKIASYFLGNLAGKRRKLSDMPRTVAALEGHWFGPFFSRQAEILQSLREHYGEWETLNRFEALGDLADEILQASGIRIAPLPNGQIYVDIPFTQETMP